MTTDNPVTWAKPEPPHPLYGSGLLAGGTEVLWPVGRNVALLGSWNGTESVLDAPAALVEKVNRRVISTAKRFVYSASEAGAVWADRQRLKWLAEKASR